MYEISTCNDISNISAIQFNPEINNGKYHTTKILSIQNKTHAHRKDYSILPEFIELKSVC